MVNLMKFNSRGDCLLPRKIGLEMTKEIRQGLKELKGIKIPQRTKSYDVVEIGHNYQPDKYSTEVLTFRDKNGEIIQRNITSKKTDNSVITTQRNYIKQSDSCVFDPEAGLDSDDMLDVFGRKISTIVKENGEYVSKSEEIQTRTIKPNGESVVTISKVENSPFGIECMEWENQSMYQYSKEGKKGYRLDNYAVSRDTGNNLNMLIGEENSVFENMENLAEGDRYFPLHLYSFKRFKKMAPYTAIHPEHRIMPVEIKWFSEQPTAILSRNGFHDGSVNLNHKTLKDRFSVVKTAAHEKEHHYQMEQMYKQKVLREIETNGEAKFYSRTLTQKDVERMEKQNGFKMIENPEEAMKYQEATDNYVKAEDDYLGYRRNYKEQKSREAGRLAVAEYRQSGNRLKEEFPYAPDYQVAFSFKDENASTSGPNPLRGLLEEVFNLDF